MPAAPADTSIEQQALHMLTFLSTEDKEKILKYIKNLLTLKQIKDDERSTG